MDYLEQITMRLDELEDAIRELSRPEKRSQLEGYDKSRRELAIMLRTCRRLWTEASKESVECRRLGRKTPKFTDIEQRLTDAVDNLDRWITFANLLY